MVERIRIFSGATEIPYSECTLSKTSDQVVNTVKFAMENSSTVNENSTINLTKADGSTSIFMGQVNDKKESMLWDIIAYSNAYELLTTPVNTVYTNRSPEYIVQDLVDNYTLNLNYASITSSGLIIEKYIAKGYLIDIIKDMMEILQWELRDDELDNIYFEPPGDINNGVVFTNGDNFQIDNWDFDKTNLINKVRVVGGFENYNITETITGTGTTFDLSQKPSGSMVVTGLDPEDYVVNAEDKQVVFNSTQTDPEFQYSYDRPIVIEAQDDESINLINKVIFKEVQAPWVNTRDDAREYAQKYLDSRALATKVKGTNNYLNFGINVNETVIVKDPLRSNRQFTGVINKITYNGAQGTTTYEIGSRVYEFFDWQRETETRIKDIEKRFTNIDEVTLTRLINSRVSVEITPELTFEYASPYDSFWLNHKTLSRIRSVVNGHVENFEADCSDNNNDGTWYGTGIDGSQYNNTGWRLSSGEFNGSDRYISVSDSSTLDLASDLSISLAVKVDSLPSSETYLLNKWDGTDGYALRIASDNKIELIYSDSSSDSTIKASTSLTAGEFQHLTFIKLGTSLSVYVNNVLDNSGTGGSTIGTNSSPLEIGRYSTNYFSGEIDEVRIYNKGISTDGVSDIYSKLHYEDGLVCYLTMDNPRLGLRTSSRQTVI